MARWPLAVALAFGVLTLSGCADTSAVVDAGRALSPPSVPEPLWTVRPTASPEGPESPAPPERPEPLPGLKLRADADAKSLDAKAVAAKDPGMTAELQQSAARCKPKSGCGMRPPVLRDLTGDGRPELMMLIDLDPRFRSGDEGDLGLGSQLYAYRVNEGRVYQILGLAVEEDSQVDLQGRDLVIRQTVPQGWSNNVDQVMTTRYHWAPEIGILDVASTVTGPALATTPPAPSPSTTKTS
ncbi:hypothetical protein [Streptomyces sp. NBC_01304]|uniref:hypothetical protein n=1 Tax=Streptomyces sp. NBC_01304 TaxID=2903818 RepID=UPI002E0DC9FB|nr:hypothetical protein OG430_02680 [Streptomyces sp. NBC_01304]